jgi:hypothetical protein
MTELQKLRAENSTLRDLLETAYRKVDEARLESEKADDECLELKAKLLHLEAISQHGRARDVSRYRFRVARSRQLHGHRISGAEPLAGGGRRNG